MSRPRSRSIAVVATMVAVFVLVAPAVASANTTVSTYHAKADATALNLQLFGQGLTLGLTHADVASDPKASGRGVGALLPGPTAVTEEKYDATADGDNEGTANPPVCGPISLPANFPVVSLSTACADATAAIGGGLPTSTADGVVATADVNANQVLTPLGDQVNAPVGDLLAGLQDVFKAVKDNANIDAQTLLDQIIAAITTDGDLVQITLGPARSTSSATGDTVSAGAFAQGAVIKVLPRTSLELDPVITIEVGASSNTVDVDRTTGDATVHFDPALVRVTLADDIATALGLQANNPIEIAPGQSQCLGLPAPLDSCITVAGGTQGKTDEGGTHAEAAGVSLHLLTGVQDGIRLDLANTAVEGFANTDVALDAPPSTTADLARTGGTVDTLLGGSLFAVAIGGMMLVRRSQQRFELR